MSTAAENLRRKAADALKAITEAAEKKKAAEAAARLAEMTESMEVAYRCFLKTADKCAKKGDYVCEAHVVAEADYTEPILSNTIPDFKRLRGISLMLYNKLESEGFVVELKRERYETEGDWDNYTAGHLLKIYARWS